LYTKQKFTLTQFNILWTSSGSLWLLSR